MKKDVQFAMNEWVKNAYDKLMDEMSGRFWFDEKQLRSCNAYVIETPNYYVLRSYHTIVACISKFDKDYCNKGLNYWGCTNRLTYRDK